ncbi:hypothetical protein PIB30_094786, partial [Stylosanthes scabra]|nr:hypothetical protein [Stylosanthes scabra]
WSEVRGYLAPEVRDYLAPKFPCQNLNRASSGHQEDHSKRHSDAQRHQSIRCYE